MQRQGIYLLYVGESNPTVKAIYGNMQTKPSTEKSSAKIMNDTKVILIILILFVLVLILIDKD